MGTGNGSFISLQRTQKPTMLSRNVSYPPEDSFYEMVNALVHRLATSRLREYRRRARRSRSGWKLGMKSPEKRLLEIIECYWPTKSRTTVTTIRSRVYRPIMAQLHPIYLPVYFLIGSLHCLYLLFLDCFFFFFAVFLEVTTLLSKQRHRQTLKPFLA